jgi:hypothetical protein
VDISLRRRKGRRDRSCLQSDSIRMKLAEAIRRRLENRGWG